MTTPVPGLLPRDPNDIPAIGIWSPGYGIFPLQGGTPTQDGNGKWSVPALVGYSRSASVVLNQASAAQTTSGNSSDLSVGGYGELVIDANITAISGTSPTLQFFFDRKGADSIYYPIWQSNSVTAISMVSTTVGYGMGISQGFGSTIRLRWVIAGTTPSFTFSASIIGK